MNYKLWIIILLLSFVGPRSFSQDIPQPQKGDSLKTYQIQKLKEEIRQLQSENAIKPILRLLPSYAGILTALVAVIGAIISYMKYLREKHHETEQKILENKARLEAKFDSIIKNLGSTSPSLQASAAVSLMTFLKPQYQEFHQQSYLILLANLKTKLPEHVNALMVKTFEKAIRIRFEANTPEKTIPPFSLELDLSHANLYRIDLHGLNLESVDLAFSDLRNANLEGCNLRRARGYKTNLSGARLSRSNLNEGRFHEANFEQALFHRSNLVSAKLKNTNLRGAEFQQARLQDALLDGSDIRGAKFAQANLNNTFLRKVKYSESDLGSLLKSKADSWKKAHFPQELLDKLKKMASV